MANVQTKATAKYQEKVGLISKSYKIKKSLADDFAKACEVKGISQAKQLSLMMEEFINNTKNE